MVIVEGQKEKHTEGEYYIEWRDASKRVRLSVGKDAAYAGTMRLRKEQELNQGDGAVPPQKGANGNRSLASVVAAYLEQVRLTKEPKTYAAYRPALAYLDKKRMRCITHL